MRQALHNFTEIELSAEHERLLSKGKGFVPAVSDTPENAARTVMKELDHFLVKYSERFGIKLPDRGRFSNVKDYLQEICALDSIGEEHRQFFGQLAARVKDAVAQARRNCEGLTGDLRDDKEMEEFLRFNNAVIMGK